MRINCYIADRYFQLCRQDHAFPSREGLKEFGRAYLESKEKTASRRAPRGGKEQNMTFAYSIASLSTAVKRGGESGC